MKSLFLVLALLTAPTVGLAHGNDNGHENGNHDGDSSTNVNVSTETAEIGGYFDSYAAEQAAPIAGSETGCHTGASAQGMTIGGSLGGASVSCDALNALSAMHAAQKMNQPYMAKLVRFNFLVRSTLRPVLSVLTLGLL